MSTITSDQAYGLDLDPKTFEALVQFSRRRRSLLILRSLAAGVIALIGVMLLVALCDYLWLLDDSVRWLLSLTGYGLVFATMWIQGLGRISENDPRRLARQLESTEPRLREDLLSAVELADPELVNGSAGFRQKLQRRVAHRVASIDISRLLPVGLVRRWLITGLVAVCVCAALLMIPEMQFGRRIARAMLPGLAIQRASLTELTIIEPSPPTGYVAEGDAVAVVVRVAGAAAETVTLRWKTEEGLEGESEMTARINSADDDANVSSSDPLRGTENNAGTLKHDNLFAANLSIGSVPVQYQVLAGDAITLWHTLTPLPRPRVESFEKRYIFPEYAKLNDRVEQAEHGDLKALVGTTAEVTVRFDQPVENANLRFANHGIEVPLESVSDSGREFMTSIVIKTPGQYQIDATSTKSGLNNPFSPQYTITPVVDSPPVVRWSRSQVMSTLVSPLDVLTLAGSASDDLPLDRVVQEFTVNAQPVVQREIAVDQPQREIELEWQWDLMRRTDPETDSGKLESGDMVRTRLVAIDRHNNRGESRWIEFLITDEGFDVQRHEPLDRLSALTVGINHWTTSLREIAKQIAAVTHKDEGTDFDSISDVAELLHDSKEDLIAQLKTVLESSTTLAEAGTLELTGRALIHLDQDLGEAIDRWSLIRQLDDPAWQQSRDKALREIAGIGQRLGHESNRLDQLARGGFGQQLAVGVVNDGMSLSRSLAPLLDDQDKMPGERFPRYLTVAVGRLEAISKLIESHQDALPDSSRRHYESWHRWMDTWSGRLREAVEKNADESSVRNLVKQFNGELQNQVQHGLVDSQLTSTLNNMFREIRNHIGPLANDVRRVTQYGELTLHTQTKIANENDSRALEILNRDQKLHQADLSRTLEWLRSRLSQEEALHRRRPVVDLQYAADMKLLSRAIENVSQDGYQPYREEIPVQVYQKLANAFQMIEAKHRADLQHGELAALLDAERRLDSQAMAKIMHPWWLERYSIGMEWPVRWLQNLNVPWSEVEPIERSRYNDDCNKARDRITSRRWKNEEILTADAPLTSLERGVATALVALEPRVIEARETIQQYVLSLAEQAREAAEKAREAQERTESREDSQNETAEELAQQQTEAEQAAQETVESLADLANTSEITDEESRELARDADAAAAQIQDAVDRAKQEMEQAKDAENEQARSDALDRTAQALEDLSEALEQTANHFERAENGEDVSDSREQLRQAEEALQVQDDLQARFDEAQEMADVARSDPEELMRKLEEELQTNEPMQEELSDIAQRAAEAAQRTLEQAAEDEKNLNRALERSDATFQEEKRRAARQLDQLAKRAATVDASLLNATEQSIGWANKPEVRPKLAEARQKLREAIQDANQMGGENALLSDIQQTAKQMSEAIEKAGEAIQEVQQQTAEAADHDIHQNDAARNQAKQQVERFERDARNNRVQAASIEKRDWSRAQQEAGRRVQQAQRQQRDAETAKRRVEDQMKRDPNNREALQQQLDAQQKRVDEAQRAEQAARETREFAEQKAKEADQRSREVKQEKALPLDKPNPAAQLASQMTEKAGEELKEILGQLSEVEGDTQDIANELRAPAAETQQRAAQQQRIQEDVSDAVEQLERAARHEQRLGQSELAQQLSDAAEMIENGAAQATEEAAQSLEAASQDAAQTPNANRDLSEATEQINAAADQLAELLQGMSTEPADSDAPSQPSALTQSEADGQQLARTLDELDRALNQPAQPADGSPQSQQAQNSQPQDGQPQPGEQAGQSSEQPPGQQPGQPSQQPGQQTAAQASPTLAQSLNQQAQEAARQRQQQMQQANQGNEPSPGEQQAANNTMPSAESGMPGEMPADGIVDVSDVDRDGKEWGQLRERRTDDATESKSTMVAPEYRREIEAYFRAVARRAAEKSK